MAKNLFVEYVEESRKSIYKYLKFIFKKNYDEEVAKVYVDTYINSRYYNLSFKESSRVFYLRIKESLVKKMNELLKENEETKKRTGDYVTYKRKEKIIPDMFTAFDYIFFFDKVRDVETMKKITTIEEVVDRLYEKRKADYQIRERQSTKGQFLKLVEDNMHKAEIFLDKYFADNTFDLGIKKYPGNDILYSVDLIVNIRIPMIYSAAAIEVAYNSETIKEERLIAEYLLLSLIVARDIVEINFKDQYLVEFAPTLIKKQKKLGPVLENINDPALQDKINLKITYSDFIKYKDGIFALMREGYKFAIVLDSSFKDKAEIKKLQMFSYIIVSKQVKSYKQLEKSYKKVDKIIFE